MSIVSTPPGCRGAGDFQKFSAGEGLENFWSAGGLSLLAEDFDKFCKNVIEMQ